jgi:alpha-glucosidase
MREKKEEKSVELPWWKSTTVYQIYPRSFKDNNGDGIGDLSGIISKLDYLLELGIETIWLSPFFASPQGDFGYDVCDYFSVAPEYGDMSECRRLIREVHERGMKIVFDMVLNHTSDRHPWFVESRSDTDNPKRGWYLWRQGKRPTKKMPGGSRPPNNWKSYVSGRGWHYDRRSHMWYWAAFLPFQPDLNYRNPEVEAAMFDMLRFWLEEGVDGFRLDILGSVFEDPQFRNNPLAFKLFPNEDDPGSFFHTMKRTVNHPENFAFARRLRRLIEEYSPKRYLVGEVFGRAELLKHYLGGEKPDGLHSVFLFQTLSTPLKAAQMRRLIEEFERLFPEPYIPVWAFSNHDRSRRISRLGGDERKAKLNAALQLTVRGVPYLYYGEEIGLRQHQGISFRQALDPVAHRFTWLPEPAADIAQSLAMGSLNRDRCRTPMQWGPGENAEFSSAGEAAPKPWLPIGPGHERINVQRMKEDPESIYHCYRRFLHLRRQRPALNSGSLTLVEEKTLPKEVLAYTRRWREESLLVILNMSGKKLCMRLPEGYRSFAASTRGQRDTEVLEENRPRVELWPWEAVVLA